MNKNTNLAITITSILFSYPDIPLSIEDGVDRFHKNISYDSATNLWTTIPITPGSGYFEEKDKDSDAGLLFEQKLKFVLPGEDDSNTQFFDLLRRPLLIKIIFSKGMPKLMGFQGNPARAERLLKSSANDSGSECVITCISTEPAWWISAETPYSPSSPDSGTTTMKIFLKGYCAKIDSVDDNTIYRGYPEGGTAFENDSTWAIELLKRNTETGEWDILWAEGNEECIFKWSDRLFYDYKYLI